MKRHLPLVKNLLQRCLEYDYIVIGLFLWLFLVMCVSNFNLYYMEQIDLFQFIDDGRKYRAGSLPGIVHAPPGNPIVITLLAPFFSFFLFPEIIAAKVVNIVAVTISILLLFLLAKHYFNKVIALCVSLFLIFHPLTLLMAVGTGSEALFTLVVLATLFAFSKGLRQWSLILAGLSYFVRTEGILLLLVLSSVEIVSTYEYLYKLKSQALIKVGSYKKLLIMGWGFLLSYVLVLGWTLVTYLNNARAGVLYGNFFIQEVVNRSASLPEYRFISNYFYLFLPTSNELWLNQPFNLVVFGFIILIFLVIQALRYKNKIAVVISLFSSSYLLLHTFFPAYDVRYLLPVLFTLSLAFLFTFSYLFKNENTKLVILLFFIIAIPGNYFFNSSSMEFFNIYHSHNEESRLAAEWIEQYSYENKKNVSVIHPISWLFSFKNPLGLYAGLFGNGSTFENTQFGSKIVNKVNGSSIEFVQILNFPHCETISCMVKEMNTHNEVLVVFDGQTRDFSFENVNDRKVLLFHQDSDEKCLETLSILKGKYKHAEIKRFNAGVEC